LNFSYISCNTNYWQEKPKGGSQLSEKDNAERKHLVSQKPLEPKDGATSRRKLACIKRMYRGHAIPIQKRCIPNQNYPPLHSLFNN